MRSARHNLEDQVGGLVDHRERRPRRATAPPPPEDTGPARYPLTRTTVAIRAAQAVAESAQRTHDAA